MSFSKSSKRPTKKIAPVPTPTPTNAVKAADFLQRRTQRDAERTAQARESYVRLLPAFARGELSTDDEQTLLAAIDELEMTNADVEADLAIHREVDEAELAASKLGEVDATVAKMKAEFEAAEKKHMQTVADSETQLAAVAQSYEIAVGHLRNTRGAEERAGELRRERSDLFPGEPSTAQWFNRRHLISIVAGRPRVKFLHDVCEIELIMSNPERFEPAREYVPFEGQSQQELDNLLGLAATLRMKKQADLIVGARYISDTATIATMPRDAHNLIIAADVLDVGAYFDTRKYEWLPLPGRTVVERDTLLRKLNRRLEAERQRTQDLRRDVGGRTFKTKHLFDQYVVETKY